MALILKEQVDKIEVVNADSIPMVQVRVAKWVEDDVTGEIFGGKQFSRHVVSPDDDVTGEDEIVKGVAGTVHTPEVKAAWQAKKAAEAAPVETPVSEDPVVE